MVPSPSLPSAFRPQHRAVPPPFTAQLWSVPAESEVTPVRPGTATGDSLVAVVPSPSWPNPFAPQHTTVPFATTAQPWRCPADTWVAPVCAPGGRHALRATPVSTAPRSHPSRLAQRPPFRVVGCTATSVDSIVLPSSGRTATERQALAQRWTMEPLGA